MSDAYVECMVARKTPGYWVFLKYLLIVLTVLTGLVGLVANLLLIAAIIFGVAAYFVNLYTDVEFEYLYLDKEITVDKVFNKTRRKRVKVFELEKIEIMAPLRSYRLDNYKNRTFKELDLSSGIEGQPEVRYVFYYNGETKVIFEPNAELVKMCKNAAPRKVFTD